MFYYLANLDEFFGPLRLFYYVTFRAGGALFTALIISLLLGPLTVKLLKKFSATAPSRLKGLVPDELLKPEKDKTPSMGGILIVFAVTISTILWAMPENGMVWAFLFTLISLSLVGFLDDYVKVAYKNRDGIPGRLKLFLQISIAILAAWFLFRSCPSGANWSDIFVPFYKYPIFADLPLWIMLGFAALVMVGSSNAVNLTDGKDGLAVGCSIFCSLTYAIFAYMCGHKIFAAYLSIPYIQGASEVGVFAAALAGACIGFLWFNCYPASMFMGDTGSLALGGSIGLIAILVKQEIVLALVGGVFVIEAVSVMIQVTSFKLFKKRVFLCTPIHHHFERKGWTETQIVVRFWIMSGLFALLGLATLKIR
ncbi:MAG: phospho-N-acetylmuramoyl-pentapeptide-transferase [Candidatus Nanoarchaeia archaeon]